MHNKRTALLVDRNRLFREGLKQLLQTAGVTVAGDGMNFPQALEKMNTDTLPDLAICSLQVIQSTTVESREFKKRYPQTRLMVLSEDFSLPGAVYSAEIGADAYLPTDMQAEALEHCLNLVLMGQQLFPAHIAQASERTTPLTLFPGFIRQQTAALGRPKLDITLPVQLSERERQILGHLVSGCSNKLIARELTIAEATVKLYVKRLMRKVQAVNRTQIVIWALSHGTDALQKAS